MGLSLHVCTNEIGSKMISIFFLIFFMSTYEQSDLFVVDEKLGKHCNIFF